VIFFAILGCDAHLESAFSLKYAGDRPRQPAYEIKLMLSGVSWAFAQFSWFMPRRSATSWGSWCRVA